MDEQRKFLRNSELTPQELVKWGVRLARSTQPADQELLREALGDSTYLTRLDPPEDYLRYPPQQLRLARIFKVLFMNDDPVARLTLVKLTAVKTFNDSDAREELLVKGLAVVRPAPPEAVRYWDAHSGPDSIHLHFTIDALCKNGSVPAVALLEKKLTDPAQDFDYKITWMRDPVLRHRNDLPLLRACYRMLTTTLSADLKPYLAEALCDYRRDEWYHSCSPPVPPSRALASNEARHELRRICEYAEQHLSLSAEQLAAVKRTLAELGRKQEG